MGDNELKKTVKLIQTLKREHKASPKAARAFLVRAGIVKKNGKLTKVYQEQGA